MKIGTAFTIKTITMSTAPLSTKGKTTNTFSLFLKTPTIKAKKIQQI